MSYRKLVENIIMLMRVKRNKKKTVHDFYGNKITDNEDNI
jgi:hypothetical protein